MLHSRIHTSKQGVTNNTKRIISLTTHKTSMFNILVGKHWIDGTSPMYWVTILSSIGICAIEFYCLGIIGGFVFSMIIVGMTIAGSICIFLLGLLWLISKAIVIEQRLLVHVPLQRQFYLGRRRLYFQWSLLVSLLLCLCVCWWSASLKGIWTCLPEIFRISWKWCNEQLSELWGCSGSPFGSRNFVYLFIYSFNYFIHQRILMTF